MKTLIPKLLVSCLTLILLSTACLASESDLDLVAKANAALQTQARTTIRTFFDHVLKDDELQLPAEFLEVSKQIYDARVTWRRDGEVLHEDKLTKLGYVAILFSVPEAFKKAFQEHAIIPKPKDPRAIKLAFMKGKKWAYVTLDGSTSFNEETGYFEIRYQDYQDMRTPRLINLRRYDLFLAPHRYDENKLDRLVCLNLRYYMAEWLVHTLTDDEHTKHPISQLLIGNINRFLQAQQEELSSGWATTVKALADLDPKRNIVSTMEDHVNEPTPHPVELLAQMATYNQLKSTIPIMGIMVQDRIRIAELKALVVPACTTGPVALFGSGRGDPTDFVFGNESLFLYFKRIVGLPREALLNECFSLIVKLPEVLPELLGPKPPIFPAQVSTCDLCLFGEYQLTAIQDRLLNARTTIRNLAPGKNPPKGDIMVRPKQGFQDSTSPSTTTPVSHEIHKPSLFDLLGEILKRPGLRVLLARTVLLDNYPKLKGADYDKWSQEFTHYHQFESTGKNVLYPDKFVQVLRPMNQALINQIGSLFTKIDRDTYSAVSDIKSAFSSDKITIQKLNEYLSYIRNLPEWVVKCIVNPDVNAQLLNWCLKLPAVNSLEPILPGLYTLLVDHFEQLAPPVLEAFAEIYLQKIHAVKLAHPLGSAKPANNLTHFLGELLKAAARGRTPKESKTQVEAHIDALKKFVNELSRYKFDKGA